MVVLFGFTASGSFLTKRRTRHPGHQRAVVTVTFLAAGRLAGSLLRMDLVILDELGYLPFSQAGGGLLFRLLSKLYGHTSVVITTHLDRRATLGLRIRSGRQLPCFPHFGG